MVKVFPELITGNIVICVLFLGRPLIVRLAVHFQPPPDSPYVQVHLGKVLRFCVRMRSLMSNMA